MLGVSCDTVLGVSCDVSVSGDTRDWLGFVSGSLSAESVMLFLVLLVSTSLVMCRGFPSDPSSSLSCGLADLDLEEGRRTNISFHFVYFQQNKIKYLALHCT